MRCYFPGTTCHECVSNIASGLGARDYVPGVPETIIDGDCDNPPAQSSSGRLIGSGEGTVESTTVTLQDGTQLEFGEGVLTFGDTKADRSPQSSLFAGHEKPLWPGLTPEVREFRGVDGSVSFVRIR
jgi:hypothetical protein